MCRSRSPSLRRSPCISVLAAVGALVAAPPVEADKLRPLEPQAKSNEMIEIPRGSYRPFFKRADGAQAIDVPAFRIQSEPISRSQFLEFVRKKPEWRRSHVKPFWAERTYLEDWRDDLDPGANLDEPVTSVSWFAARAYCRENGGLSSRLPSVAEWERAAGKNASLDSKPKSESSLHERSKPFEFAMGDPAIDLRGLPLRIGAVWEWTEDFNSTPALQPGTGSTGSKFCGDGIRSNDATDYASFLRYSLRSSLRANYTLKNLGFRCAN